MSRAYQLTDGWQCAHLGERSFEELEKPKKKWKPFQPPGTPPKYTRDRVVDVRHIKLDIKLDVKGKSIQGIARLVVRPIADEVRSLELDAVELQVAKASCEGQALEFTCTGEKLILKFETPLAPDQDVTLEIHYRATPRRGLYFVGPSRHYPKKHAEVWSQGEDEDNRRWFPCFDYPCEKATSELLATVPGKWFCLSNGRLLERKKNRDGTATFHWLQEIPHVSYLITLCAGEYEEVADEWDGISVNYYVPPGRKADGERAFGKTPKMVEFYSKLIGVRYPFAKYAQITASDFLFGGMENTSATTQTERTLHDARAHLDFSSDPLVSHELVHSWFGNLLTCRDWSHAWLNESFATFFDNLWCREDLGEDEFRYEMYADLQGYLEEDSGKYRRPIMTNVYRAPMDLFDRHLYNKGACFLNLLRNILGDRLFFKAIRLYTERHREQTVVTQDLLEALEDATGRNFDWLFEQWIFKGGHPEFEISCAWDAKTGTAALHIRQKQTPDEMTPVFRVPLKVRFAGKEYDETRAFEIADAAHVFHVALPERPRWIAFDPANSIPKTVALKFDEDQLAAQLREDDDCMGRVYAVQALAKLGTARATEELARALLQDKFWGVQAECAEGLAKLHTPSAFEALVAGTKVKHPKARRAVARALGAWRTEQAARTLKPLARRDASYYVEAAAATALGKTRIRSVWSELLNGSRKTTWQDTVRCGAFSGMVELDPAKALPVLEAFARPGKPELARFYALGLLGRAAYETHQDAAKTRVRKLLEEVLDQGLFFECRAAIPSLRQLRDPAAIAALTRFKNSALDQRLVRAAEEALRGLRDSAGIPPEMKALRGEVEKLKEESGKLKDQLAKLAAGKGAKRGKRVRGR